VNNYSENIMSKVPQVTLLFWVLKIISTTLGETGGDAVSMKMNLGYLAATGIFFTLFVLSVSVQIFAKKFHPLIYWFTIITTTTVGTTLADFTTRSLGIGYLGGSMLLLTLLIGCLALWYSRLGTVSVASVNQPKAEVFYWLTIMFSQTLGTALGDWTADTAGVGYLGSAVLFSGILIILLAANYLTTASKTLLFWSAFVLTRPLGAVLGDFLDKSPSSGGLGLSHYGATAALLSMMLFLLFSFKQSPASKAH
jgi:uncharacterized membrane-anchored protein